MGRPTKLQSLAALALCILQSGLYVTASPQFIGPFASCEGFKVTFPPNDGPQITYSPLVVKWDAPTNLQSVEVTLVDASGNVVPSEGASSSLVYPASTGTAGPLTFQLNGNTDGEYHYHLKATSSDNSTTCNTDSSSFRILPSSASAPAATSAPPTSASPHTNHLNAGSSYFTDEYHHSNDPAHSNSKSPYFTDEHRHAETPHSNHWNSKGSYFTDEHRGTTPSPHNNYEWVHSDYELPSSLSHPDTGDWLVHPNTVHPDTVHPDTVHPDTVHPDTVHPDTVHPDTVHPDTGDWSVHPDDNHEDDWHLNSAEQYNSEGSWSQETHPNHADIAVTSDEHSYHSNNDWESENEGSHRDDNPWARDTHWDHSDYSVGHGNDGSNSWHGNDVSNSWHYNEEPTYPKSPNHHINSNSWYTHPNSGHNDYAKW